MAAIDQPVFGGLPLDLSFGIGEHVQRLADQRPALVAGNMLQRIALWRREADRWRGHTLHRHGRCSGLSLAVSFRREQASAVAKPVNNPWSLSLQRLIPRE